MRLRSTLTVLLVMGLVAAPTAAAAVPYWWWTNAHANRAIVAKNFQFWSHQGESPHTTVLKATCRGYGLVKKLNGVRYYRAFNCTATWKYDTPDPTYGSGPFKSYLNCGTTKSRQLGIRCSISA